MAKIHGWRFSSEKEDSTIVDILCAPCTHDRWALENFNVPHYDDLRSSLAEGIGAFLWEHEIAGESLTSIVQVFIYSDETLGIICEHLKKIN